VQTKDLHWHLYTLQKIPLKPQYQFYHLAELDFGLQSPRLMAMLDDGRIFSSKNDIYIWSINVLAIPFDPTTTTITPPHKKLLLYPKPVQILPLQAEHHIRSIRVVNSRDTSR